MTAARSDEENYLRLWGDYPHGVPGRQERTPVERGRRVERIEWGLRTTRDNFCHRKGHVEPRPDEAYARRCLAAGPAAGWHDVELVSRTVVTYTTNWSASPVQQEDKQQ